MRHGSRGPRPRPLTPRRRRPPDGLGQRPRPRGAVPGGAGEAAPAHGPALGGRGEVPQRPPLVRPVAAGRVPIPGAAGARPLPGVATHSEVGRGEF